jgi:hypothetical protein
MYKTAQGRSIDMDKLMRQNELVPAVGNAKVNARGDKLGPGGEIIKTREEIVAEYYNKNPNVQPTPTSHQVETKTATSSADIPVDTLTSTVIQKPASSAPAEVEVTKTPSQETK